MERVPTIDISAPDDTDLAAIDRACRDHGFFLMRGHGLDALIERTWAEAEAFFAADRAHKTSIMRSEENALGYFDRELTKRRRDHKEVFDFTDPQIPAEHSRNQWPAELSDEHAFRPTMEEFFDRFADLAMQTTSVVHRAIGLDDDAAAAYQGSRISSAVRLNHYPVGDPVPEDERDGLIELGETALGYHTDPGVLTLLLQDDTGGLQAQSINGEWVDIEPQPGTVVVNLADAMQVWTNDQYRAAIHRVVPMTTRDRISIPFFLNPVRNAVIEPIPELSDGGARYRSFPWREFMQARQDDNFADLGTEDAQISDYLVS